MIPEGEKQAGFEVITQLRARIADYVLPGEETQQKYKKANDRMGRRKQLPAQIAGTKRSFYFYRAAFVYSLIGIAKSNLSKADAALKNGDWDVWRSTIKFMSGHIQRLDIYPHDQKRSRLRRGEKSLWNNENPPPSQSKRKGLGTLPDDWQERIWAGIPSKSQYRSAIAVLTCTGARPGEIEKGVAVSLNPQGGLVLTIHGIKTHGGNCGQAVRTLTVASEGPAARHLAEKIKLEGGLKGEIIVSTKAKLLTDSVRGISKKVFPKKKYIVAPYSFRHQCAADWKDYQSSEVVAQALGHNNDATQQYYGTRRQARGGVRLLGVKVSSKVTLRAGARIAKLKGSLNKTTSKPSTGFRP